MSYLGKSIPDTAFLYLLMMRQWLDNNQIKHISLNIYIYDCYLRFGACMFVSILLCSKLNRLSNSRNMNDCNVDMTLAYLWYYKPISHWCRENNESQPVMLARDSLMYTLCSGDLVWYQNERVNEGSHTACFAVTYGCHCDITKHPKGL